MSIPSKTTTDAKVAIQKMAEYYPKWHNGTSRTRSTETFNGLAAIQAQLDNLGREIKKVNEKFYVAQVGCEQCKGPHYTKYFPLKEEGKTLEEAYYTQFEIRRDQVDDLMPTIKEGEVIEEFRARNNENDFIVLEDMGTYRDEGMGDVIFGEPFLREVGINAKWFEGMITIYHALGWLLEEMHVTLARLEKNEQDYGPTPNLLKIYANSGWRRRRRHKARPS
nr:hypothetical protein [Tanacetum cinerariifolium]